MYRPVKIRAVVANAIETVKDHLEADNQATQEVMESFKLLDLTLCALLYPEDIPLIEPALSVSFNNAEALIYESQ